MVSHDILSQIETKLFLRWPRLKFGALSWDDNQVDITFDTFATESQEKQIRNFVKKFMAREYPNLQYKLERLPF